MRRAALLVLALAGLIAGCGGSGGGGGSDHAGSTKSDGGAAKSTATTAPAQLPGAHRAPNEAVPILMYHVINAPPPGTPQPELWVSRDDFAAEMSWLASHGYHGVKLQDVWNAWHRGGLLPSKPVVVSFDDGYTSQRTNALPILQSHHWPGVLNLQVNQERYDLKPPDVRAMMQAGWEVDAHTFTHPDLTTVGDAQLRHEVADSRTVLRRTFGVPVNFFCYPAGRTDAHVIAAVKAAGYLGATTTDLGRAAPTDDPYALHRVRVNGSDGVNGLAKNLASIGA